MKIALLVILFLVGSIGGAMQALKYADRQRRRRTGPGDRRDQSPPDGPG